MNSTFLHEISDHFAGVPTSNVDLVGSHVEGVKFEHVVPLLVNFLQNIVDLRFSGIELK